MKVFMAQTIKKDMKQDRSKSSIMRACAILFCFVLIGSLSVSNVFADSITTPLNNSILNIGQSYNITININSITTTATSDIATLLINNSIIYQNNFTSNGLYKIPIQFNNYGHFNISLITSTSKTIDQNISVPAPMFQSELSTLNMYFLYYFVIILIWFVSLFLSYFLFKGNDILSKFILLIASISSFTILITTYNLNINQFIYYISILSFGASAIFYSFRILTNYV